MGDDGRLAPRQIWAQPTTSSTKTYHPGCTPFVLPSEGYIYLNLSYSIALSENAVFEPVCTSTATASRGPSPMLDTRDPFYASVTPQLYAIGCATVVSYLLVIILLITPRTFYVGGPGGGANFLGRHGMISGSYSGNSSVVGVGGRPWLQKVAALLVAISLTIATADSFKVAEDQYIHGYSDADALASEVIDGMEIRVIRVISSTFLWLAQVQTLIRLFPRHKEKVMIKWAGFALIVLDTIFSILDKFLVQSNTTRPRLYEDAIPALSYLFELALNLLYAAWVIFYSLSKHRFAFFHPKMRNICLVALLSLCAVLIPVVFFVLDIAKPEVAGWGTYIRWVGSAAASVVVWEWVERIEALERDERKDGILGREIFDGDEMLEVTPSEEVDWPRQNNRNDRGGGTGTSSGWGGMMGLAQRPLRTRVGHPGGRNRQTRADAQNPAIANDPRHRGAARPTPPPVAVTPVSRADTTSAASTVYNVHYHPVSSPTPPVAMPHMEEENEPDDYGDVATKELDTAVEEHRSNSARERSSVEHAREESPQIINVDDRWRTILNPFRRRRASLPREVASAQAEEQDVLIRDGDELYHRETSEQDSSRPTINRLFALNRKPRPGTGRQGSDTPLPVTVIPARRRGQHTWSPEWFTESSLLEPSPGQQPRPSRTDLPVRVIQPQAHTAAPWAAPNEGEFGYGNYELRYDPEAAALVGPDEAQSQPQSTDNACHDTYIDPQRPSVAERHRQTQELDQSAPEQPQSPQHPQPTNSLNDSQATLENSRTR
ncbi:pH signal transduction protein PalH [Aspergillus bombycis]|uniref:pH signal transduction protein PalH n=1 Tax=Aspergillus bombycis TaxID=109264 RepID=A0A1F8AAR7_9EURO|nr:pH signal transduction protein PalH [Aspergillus bombycis]OGM48806.1 pH signal transduction protein PalH [Aspergillus bombycis]